MTILIHIDWNRRLPFYRRLEAAFQSLGHRVVFLSSSLSVWLMLKREGRDAALCRFGRVANGPLPDLSETREAKCLYWPQRRLASLHAGVLSALQQIHGRHGIGCVLLWNGGGVAGAAIRNFARQNGIPTGFLEIANIAGKLFVDPEGVNARASIAREPDRLLHYPADPARFEAWRAAYLETKLNSHIIPQAMSVQPVNWWRLADLAGAWLGVPDIAMESLNAKFQRIVLRRGAASAMLPEDSFDPRATDYVFFPLQLSNDTNVVLNSSVGNEQALKKAAAEAHARGCRLVVKLHPAETDRNFVRRIGALKQSIDFLVSRANTFVLIANAQLVVTINSTVGIEARLLGRPVEVYGRALYGGFSDAHLRHYLLGWLLDIDAFGGGAISPESAAAILERAGAETGSPHAHAWSRNR